MIGGGCSKTFVLFFISRVRSTGFRDQFLGARKRGESSAKGLHTYLIMSRPIMKETKSRLRKSKFKLARESSAKGAANDGVSRIKKNRRIPR